MMIFMRMASDESILDLVAYVEKTMLSTPGAFIVKAQPDGVVHVDSQTRALYEYVKGST